MHHQHYQVAFVEQHNHVLLPGLLFEVPLQVAAAGAHGVPCINYLNDDVTRVHHLVQFTPDAFALALVKHAVAYGCTDAVGRWTRVVFVAGSKPSEKWVRVGVDFFFLFLIDWIGMLRLVKMEDA